ncbi:MAG: hypothetical protein KDN20_11815 [Verrucomicrobiae bacterium]|nr:hypothetical protein [Verrucomicrobiae bacterium]
MAFAFGESRTFTSDDGRKIEAEMVAFRANSAHVRMNGRNFSIPLEKLSSDDQAWVKDWAKRNTDYRLDFSERVVEHPHLREAKKKRDEKDRKESFESESRFYELRIGNRSGLDLTNLTVQYQIVVRKTHTEKLTIGGSKKQETPRFVTGAKKVNLLANTDHVKLTLDTVRLETHEWQERGYVLKRDSETGREYAVYHWDDYGDEERLDGVWVKVFMGNILVGEWKSEGKIVDEVQWAGDAAPVEVNAGQMNQPEDPLAKKKLELSQASDDHAAALRDRLPDDQISQKKERFEQILREYEDLILGK